MNPRVLFSLLIFILLACDQEGENQPLEKSTVTVNDISITESEETRVIVLDIFLSKPQNDPVIIKYSTQDGSAEQGTDYEAAEGSVTLETGDLRETLTLNLLGDESYEEEEVFYVKFNARSSNVQIDSDLITVTINDNDEAPGNELIIPTDGYESPQSYEGWSLVWQDEFDQNEVNQDDWTYEIGNGQSGWGNNESQYYTNENTSMVDGNLVIIAKKEQRSGFNYTSTRMITKGKQEFQYGRVDIRAVLPYGQGIWPALWMLGGNIDQVSWPACGEIDIMEMIGGNNRDNTVHGTVHWSNNGSYANYGGHKTLSSGDFNDKFHVFSIIWDENSIKWLLDGVQFHVIDITPDALSEFRQEHFFIFNVAVGGNWPGYPDATTTFPQYMVVDYIRVFQK